MDDDVGDWFSGRFAWLKLTLYIAACVAVPCLLVLWAAWRFG